MSAKKTRKLTRKQAKLVEGIVAGKSGAAAARDAGYSPETAKQAAYQTMKAIGDRAREVLDAKGLTLEQIIDFYLLPLLEAKERKFFPWRKVTGKKVEQIIDRRDVAALGTRCFAVDVLFRLRGDYAPKKLGLDPDEGRAVNIHLGGIPRHNVPGSMISRSTTGRGRCDDGHYGGEGGIIPNAICCWDALGCVFSIPQPIASQRFILNPLKPS